jgi:hypothetical protein
MTKSSDTPNTLENPPLFIYLGLSALYMGPRSRDYDWLMPSLRPVATKLKACSNVMYGPKKCSDRKAVPRRNPRW